MKIKNKKTRLPSISKDIPSEEGVDGMRGHPDYSHEKAIYPNI